MRPATSTLPCRARSANAPPATGTNSLRIASPPRLRTGHRTDKNWLTGRAIMSALGHKRTFAGVDIGFLWRTPMLAFS